MFNLKKGNKPVFVAEKGVPEWKQYEERAAQATEVYVDAKKNPKITKSEMIEMLIDPNRQVTYETIEEMYDVILSISHDHRTVFSVNAIREIIMYVSFLQFNNLPVGQQVKDSVLKIFR